MDRSIKIVRQLERVFEAYCMSFKDFGGGDNVSGKERKTLTYTKTVCLGEGESVFRSFSLFAGETMFLERNEKH